MPDGDGDSAGTLDLQLVVIIWIVQDCSKLIPTENKLSHSLHKLTTDFSIDFGRGKVGN